MQLTKRTGDRASDIKRSTTAAWYLAVCFVICLAGLAWLASLLGVVDFGTRGDGQEVSKLAARQAAQKAAMQQALARSSAQEEARNIAEDATRLIKAPVPTQPADPAASAQGMASAPAPQPAATAPAKATPQ
jgi:hypothetical protein